MMEMIQIPPKMVNPREIAGNAEEKEEEEEELFASLVDYLLAAYPKAGLQWPLCRVVCLVLQ